MHAYINRETNYIPVNSLSPNLNSLNPFHNSIRDHHVF